MPEITTRPTLRLRVLAVVQAVLILASLFAPVPAMAVDPSAPPDSPPASAASPAPSDSTAATPQRDTE